MAAASAAAAMRSASMPSRAQRRASLGDRLPNRVDLLQYQGPRDPARLIPTAGRPFDPTLAEEGSNHLWQRRAAQQRRGAGKPPVAKFKGRWQRRLRLGSQAENTPHYGAILLLGARHRGLQVGEAGNRPDGVDGGGFPCRLSDRAGRFKRPPVPPRRLRGPLRPPPSTSPPRRSGWGPG